MKSGNERNNKILGLLENTIHGLACFSVSLILFVILFTKIQLKTKEFDLSSRIFITDKIPNWLWCILLLALCIVISKMPQREKRLSNKTLLAIQLCIFVGQIFIMSHIYFVAGNDLHNILMGADLLVHGQYDLFYNTQYYQQCPNNLMLYAFIILATYLADILRINTYVLLIGCNILLSNIAVLLIQLCLRILEINRKFVLISYIISIVLIAFSPWNIVPYTDMLSIVFPILSYYIYLRIREKDVNLILKSLIISIIPVVLCQFKVLNLIVFLAIGLTEIIVGERNKISAILKSLMGVSLSIAISMAVNLGVNVITQYTPDSDKALSIEWYLLLGTNKEAYGQWNYEDFNLAVTPKTRDERQKVVYSEITNRIKTYGVCEWIKHFSNKIHMFYNDGTFGWGVSGGLVEYMPNSNSRVTQLMRQIFYPNENYNIACSITGYGRYYMGYAMVCQCVWIWTVCGIFCFIWKKSHNIYHIVLEITFLGVFAFTMLFEVSSRLLISYLPVFVVIMAKGLNNDERNKQ